MPIERVDLLLSSPLPQSISTADIGHFLRSCGATPYQHALYPGHEDGARYIANVTYAAQASKHKPWPVNIQRRRRLVGALGYSDQKAPDGRVQVVANHFWDQVNMAARYGPRASDKVTLAILLVTDSPRLLAGIVFKILPNQEPINPHSLLALDLVRVDLPKQGGASDSGVKQHHFQPADS